MYCTHFFFPPQGRHSGLSGRIIHFMRRFSVIIAILLLLTSCMTSRRDETFSSEDEMRISVLLRQGERNAIIETETLAFQDLSDFPLDSTYSVYIQDLPQFRSSLSVYENLIATLLSQALEGITDSLLLELDSLAINDVLSYMEAGYSSITDELEKLYHEDVENTFLSYLKENEEALDESFALIEREARIWRENQANLDLVDQGRNIAPLAEITLEEIADYAASSYFRTLSEREVIQRSSLLSGGEF